METQYGPSTPVFKPNKQLEKELFGTDSENEKSPNKNLTEQTEHKTHTKSNKETREVNVSESENDDVLEISIESVNFSTPNKSHQYNQKSSSVLPPTPGRSIKFDTPNKLTNTSKESLTSTVKEIFEKTIPIAAWLSPIKKTPTKNVRIQRLSQVKTETLPIQSNSRSVSKHSHVQTNIQNEQTPVSFGQLSKQQKRTNEQKVFPVQHRGDARAHLNSQIRKATVQQKQVSRAQQQPRTQQKHTHTQNTSIHSVASYTKTYGQKTHTYIPNSHHTQTHSYKKNRITTSNSRITPYANTERIRTLTSIKTFNSLSHTLASSTNTQTPTKLSAVSGTIVHPQTQPNNIHNQTKSNELIATTTQSKPITSDTHTPPHSESLVVTIANTNQPNTQTERRSVSIEPQQIDSISNSNSTAPKTKILKLNNKYVPKDFNLTITIDKNKKLSKNALKKLTRKLISEM